LTSILHVRTTKEAKAMETKTRAYAGLAGVITGVMLIGTTGVTLVVGWGLWALGLAVLLVAVPSAGPRERTSRDTTRPQYSLAP
jgi:hypothetical protein